MLHDSLSNCHRVSRVIDMALPALCNVTEWSSSEFDGGVVQLCICWSWTTV